MDITDSINRCERHSATLKDRPRKQRSHDENPTRMFHKEQSRQIYKDILFRYDYPSFEEQRGRRSSSHQFHQNVRNDIYQACQVTLSYRNETSDESDQILIEQKPNDDENDQVIVVYKGYLKNGDQFSFKSQRLVQYPFHVKFHINGRIQTHLFSCCEYKYHRGGHRINDFFTIESVQKSIPCQKCQRKQNDNVREEHKRTSQANFIPSDTSEDSKESTPEEGDTRSLSNGEKSQNDSGQSTELRKVENENNEKSKSLSLSTNGVDLRQGLMQSLLELVQNRHEIPIDHPLPFREQGNVEDFVLILLGISGEVDSIRSIVNLVKIFEKSEEVNAFIEKFKFEKIILIVNDLLFQSIENLSCFHSIYLCTKKKSTKIDQSNIRGHFSNLQTIFEQIEEECSIEKNCSFSIELGSIDESTKQSFNYSQLLKETLLKKDDDDHLKKQCLDFCRFHYQGNKDQLIFIDQFEEHFTTDNALEWYRKETFLRKMINRALRTKEVEILFKMRWFIQTLNNQIKQKTFSTIISRITHLSSESLKEYYIDDLISFDCFLHCTNIEPSSTEHINDMETIFFRMETTVGIESKELSHTDYRTDVLLPLDVLFRIQSIEKIDEHYWKINLISIDKNDQQFRRLTDEMREDISSPVSIIQIGKLLLSNKDYSQADYFARSLFNDQSLKSSPTLLASLAALHHILGSLDNSQNKHMAARVQFEQSLKIFLTFLSEDNQMLSATYNNIGSMFYQEDQHEQAIEYHQKALQCQLKSSSPDFDSISTYSGNIGAVYLDQGKCDQALIYFQRSLQILKESIPNGESQSIALIYDRIASVYWRMEKPTEALSFYQKSLQLELQFLPANDHKISVSYFNISTAYASLGQLDEAIDSAQKSIEQLLKSVSLDHPEVKENTEQLEGLRRRKWLQQLYQ